MNALIIYDSVFGNTEKVARAIGDALDTQSNVAVLPVSRVTSEDVRGLDILIVGSPTRGFRPTEAVSKFLNALPKNHLSGVRVAAFDTRIHLDTIHSPVFRFIVNKGGYAAGTIARLLEKKGGNPVKPPEGFLVTSEEGPLKDGELERAAAWAGQVIR